MKSLFIAAAVMGLASGTFAQGTVFFDNNPPEGTFLLYPGAMPFAGGTFTVGLYWVNQSSGPFTSINPATATPVASIGGDNTTTGSFDDGEIAVPGLALDGTTEFEVAFWNSPTGTYAQAVANFLPVGASAPFYNSSGGSTGTPAGSHPPDFPVELTGWVGNVYLEIGPEPSTMTIAVWGQRLCCSAAAASEDERSRNGIPELNRTPSAVAFGTLNI